MLLCISLALADATALTGSVVVQVSDPAAAQAEVVRAATKAGGWFTALSDDGVTLRVPAAGARTWLDQASTLGRVVDRSWSAQSLDAPLEALHARLASRKDILEKYLAVLGDANPDAFVSVQSAISQAIAEIEQIEGQIRLYEHQAAYAQLTVSFRFVDRAAPVSDGTSSFAWLNTMNLADLQAAFRAGNLRHRSRGITAVAPDQFAAWRKTNHFAATSTDDVVYRVRVEKNKPKADLDFWTKALRVRMAAAGYRVLGEGKLQSASGLPGAWLELGAASGPVDDTYLIGLYVDGGKLIVTEAAGEATRFAARRQAVLDAMAGVRP